MVLTKSGGYELSSELTIISEVAKKICDGVCRIRDLENHELNLTKHLNAILTIMDRI
jgi:hypothetical protein